MRTRFLVGVRGTDAVVPGDTLTTAAQRLPLRDQMDVWFDGMDQRFDQMDRQFGEFIARFDQLTATLEAGGAI